MPQPTPSALAFFCDFRNMLHCSTDAVSLPQRRGQARGTKFPSVFVAEFSIDGKPSRADTLGLLPAWPGRPT
jgi:hypothetical protein